jgi:hypothetical protein
LHHRHRLGFRLTQLNWELPDEMLANWLVALQLYRVFGSWGSRGHGLLASRYVQGTPVRRSRRAQQVL